MSGMHCFMTLLLPNGQAEEGTAGLPATCLAARRPAQRLSPPVGHLAARTLNDGHLRVSNYWQQLSV